MQACQQLLYRGALVVLEILSSVYGDDSVSKETLPIVFEVVGQPRVFTAVDYRYIVLQHLRDKRLTAAATGRQYSINY